jgi:hypothetical protein
VGSFPVREAYIAAWEYEQGRTIATGAKIPLGWLEYPTGITGQNPYSPEILSNMIFWLARTQLIDDVEVYHRIRADLSIFRARIRVLMSLVDFIDKFGANTDRIQAEVLSLQAIYSRAADEYLDHTFAESEMTLNSGWQRLPHSEEMARKEKDRALLWVYAVEWLASSSAFFISGFLLWTLMVRRRLYQSVRTTKLGRARQ